MQLLVQLRNKKKQKMHIIKAETKVFVACSYFCILSSAPARHTESACIISFPSASGNENWLQSIAITSNSNWTGSVLSLTFHRIVCSWANWCVCVLAEKKAVSWKQSLEPLYRLGTVQCNCSLTRPGGSSTSSNRTNDITQLPISLVIEHMTCPENRSFSKWHFSTILMLPVPGWAWVS